MRKRIYLSLIIALSVASIAGATMLATQRAKTSSQRPAGQPGTAARRPAQSGATPAGPTRQADPNRAPQSAVDEAIYINEEFFGQQSSVTRPYTDALQRVSTLAAQYPKDARLRLHASRLSERLGQFDRATTEIVEYASLKQRSPDSLRRLAAFYHNRARYADEVRTVQELARALPVSERAPLYKQAAELVRTRSLREFRPADFFAELVTADPTNVQPVKDYVEELTLADQPTEALTVLSTFQPRFPSELAYFLKTRAQILENTGDRRAAENIYSAVFDPNWPRQIATDYYDLLRRFGRYRIARRELQQRVQSGAADLQTNARLFGIFAYEGNHQQAARVLTELETRRTGQNSSGIWNAAELQTVAGMFTSIGHYDQASRYLYTLYITGGLQPASQQREEALNKLFRVLIDAAGTPTRVAAGDLSFYRDVAETDQHPGFMNGVLSLILSATDPAQEFANQEKAAAGYFNRAFAYRIFNSFKQEYASSRHLPEMYIGVINIFSALGEHRLAIDAGREFGQRFPDSPAYVDVSLRMADSFVALKDRAGERNLLATLLDRLARARGRGTPLIPSSSKRWAYGITPLVDQLIDRIQYNIEAYGDTYDPTQGSDDTASDEDYSDTENSSSYLLPSNRRGPTYSSVLERYVSSLAAEDKKTETVAFFWNEIRKYPREEGLYERFLSWLGQAQLVNEQMRAYNTAIRQFDSNTWYHRMARWYVREKRGRELARYSRQLIDIFDEDEITEYLLRFAGYGGTAAGDGLNWDEQLALELYSYAHNRFPRNIFFVRGMLTVLAKTNVDQWEKLSAQYYFADRSIRAPYLSWLSSKGQLRDRYTRARGQNSTSNKPPTLEPDVADLSVQLPAPDTQRPTTYQIFAADSAVWLSHFDEALGAYRRLISLYPGEPQYSDRLSDLTRSFGNISDKLYEEAARVNSQMADIYPTNHSYRIKAGEVYAELGDFKRAGEQWDRLIQVEPGERNTYLEVATVYWDYYQYDQALQVFRQLRDTTGDQTVYAYRMGAVYEGKGDIDSAIAEYVKVLNEPGDGRDTVAKRLAQLARRPGLADKIAAAYNRAHTANPKDWQLVIGFASYQAERNLNTEALALLRSEVTASTDVSFLESVRDLFRSILRPEDEQQVIARLSTVARDEREAMKYQLQLAAFLERRNQVDSAIAVIDRLVSQYPTNAGVVEESARFYWRAGLTDRALDLYKRTLERARGPNRRGLVLQLARRQAEAGRLADREATLRAYYDQNRDDTEIFGELATTLGAENKLEDLAKLYESAFKDVKESGLGIDEARMRTVELRRGMIRTLDRLSRYQDAVDQYIEIINAYPEESNELAQAIEYAERHSLVDRLVGYYEKLSRESFKNYRWQLVLGRIYERRGNLGGASEQYRIAVTNEPQRLDIRLALASTLTRERKFDEAIAVLREGWALAGRDPMWLMEAARIQLQQGKRDDAVQTVRQALAAKKNATINDQMQIAHQLAGWGLNAEAVRLYAQAFAELPKTLKDTYIDQMHVTAYASSLIRTEAPPAVFQKMDQLRAQYEAIATNSQDTDGYRARSIVSSIDQSMRSNFGQGVLDYGTASDQAALSQTIRAAAAKLTSISDREAIMRYLGIAHAAGLVETEEQIYTQIKDIAFRARTRAEDLTCYTHLRALVEFYNRRAAYTRAAEMLVRQYAADPNKDRFDYHNQIANEYRLAGDRARELEWLRSAYATASGGLMEGTTDWVERYFSLVYESGDRTEFDRLASSYNPRQLQLINFLIDKKEKELARKAINNASQSAAWVASRSGEVGLFLKDTGPENEVFFRSALDIRPIGEMIGRQVDSNRTLFGDDWFVAARNYGYWLGLTPAKQTDSRRFLPAEIESKPSSARAQLELAAYYLDRKDAAKASDHLALAGELAPGAREVTVMRGLVALARGDRSGAIAAWNTLMAGRVTLDAAQTYLKVMADNGLFIEALPLIENYVIAYINTRPKNDDGGERIEAIKPLVREIASRASTGDSRAMSSVASTLQNVVNNTSGDIAVGRMIVEENLLPESALGGVYRALHQRISDMAESVFGTSTYEDGYWNGTEYFYPARALSDFRRRLLDYLIRNRSFDEARLLIITIRQEQADIALALEDTQSASDRYDWLPLASALLELRSGRDAAKAIAELRDYCGLDDTQKESDGSISHERCLKAYALLLAEKRESDADTLLYDAYGKAASSRFSDDASIAGLAEIEARRGRSDEAARLLKLMVERSSDNTRALRLAAETAARIGRYNDAADFREQIARAYPDDAVNKLELARAISAAGRKADAIDRIAILFGERSTPNSIRAQAAEAIGDIVRADRSLASRAGSALNQRAASGDAGALLALAATAEATGNADEARASLSRITGGPLAAVAQVKLGTIAAGAGRDAEAITNFERAIFLDADGAITDQIAFRAVAPRAQLIRLYNRTGRDIAAVRLAEGDNEGRRSLIPAGVQNEEGTSSAIAFEPSLEIARSRTDGLRTVAELNDAARAQWPNDIAAAVAQSFARLGDYDRAVAIERQRARDAARPEDRTAIERIIADLLAAEQAKQLRAASLTKVSRANATDSFYATHAIGN